MKNATIGTLVSGILALSVALLTMGIMHNIGFLTLVGVFGIILPTHITIVSILDRLDKRID